MEFYVSDRNLQIGFQTHTHLTIQKVHTHLTILNHMINQYFTRTDNDHLLQKKCLPLKSLRSFFFSKAEPIKLYLTTQNQNMTSLRYFVSKQECSAIKFKNLLELVSLVVQKVTKYFDILQMCTGRNNCHPRSLRLW